jgi:hypothetical protein
VCCLNTSSRFRKLCLALVIALSVSACNGHNYPDFKARELKPGDPDYPLVKPYPEQLVHFTAKIPPSLFYEMSLRYKVPFATIENPDGTLNRLESPVGCRSKPTDQFYVELPLTVSKTGDTYQGNFVVDYFQPGNCGWRFDLALSPILRNPLFWYRTEYNGGPRDLIDSRLDIWCTRKTKIHPPIDPAERNKPNQVDKNNCVSLELARGLFLDLPAGFYESIPENERTDAEPGYIGRHTKSITVEFHDLDALVSDYTKSR